MRADQEVRPSTAETKQPAGAPAPAAEGAAASKPAVVEEVLIEEVSIDGMCGVY